MAVKKCGTCAHFDLDAKDEGGVSLKCTKKALNVHAKTSPCEAYKKAAGFGS